MPKTIYNNNSNIICTVAKKEAKCSFQKKSKTDMS